MLRSQKRLNLAWIFIWKTCPCRVYPLEPHFYIGKLGFAGAYLIFLFLIQNIHSGKVQVGKDQEKAQSENDSHSKNRDGKKNLIKNQVLIP